LPPEPPSPPPVEQAGPDGPDGPDGRNAAPRGIVFDLDGTLIDSRRDIATAVNRMRAERGLAPLPVEAVSGMVGEGARVLVRRALPPWPAGAGQDDLKDALASYLAHYADVCLATTRAYPGVAAMLATLAPSFPLAVLSNKGEALSRHILHGLGLDRYLREVIGGDTLPTRKPNPGGLFLLADRMAIPAPRLLLVGDTWIDARTAQAAGCAFALTLWGEPRSGGPAVAAVAAAAGSPRVTGGGLAARQEAGGEAATDAEDATPRWRLAHPRDLPAALGLTEDGELAEPGQPG
jgi:phosphoglycolate phosphatase